MYSIALGVIANIYHSLQLQYVLFKFNCHGMFCTCHYTTPIYPLSSISVTTKNIKCQYTKKIN